MIISAANVFTVAVRKSEYDPILLVHADTVEASHVPAQFLQSIRGRNPQILNGCAGIEQVEFLLHSVPEFASDLAGGFAIVSVINVGGRRVPEAGDHRESILEYPISVYSIEAEAARVPKPI
jgi:hypothetical protein